MLIIGVNEVLCVIYLFLNISSLNVSSLSSKACGHSVKM